MLLGQRLLVPLGQHHDRFVVAGGFFVQVLVEGVLQPQDLGEHLADELIEVCTIGGRTRDDKFQVAPVMQPLQLLARPVRHAAVRVGAGRHVEDFTRALHRSVGPVAGQPDDSLLAGTDTVALDDPAVPVPQTGRDAERDRRGLHFALRAHDCAERTATGKLVDHGVERRQDVGHVRCAQSGGEGHLV